MKTTIDRRRWVRSAGILLHPTSLPGPYGIGDFGDTAYAWLEALVRAKQTWWQVLPLGPTGYGDSPYQSFSAFAGNPNLISPDLLVRDGLLNRLDVGGVHLPADRVDYDAVMEFKLGMLERAWRNFHAGSAAHLRSGFESFCEQQRSWLEDFALFMALKDAHGGASWQEWPPELILRESPALQRGRQQLADRVGLHKFRQFLFFRQWRDLKTYANARGIKLIGDVPIFIASDSADVWANPQLFQLDEKRQPRVVAGVPPDYFSATGQLWGNPLYDWKAMKQAGYAWWVARLRATLEQVDLIRLDHFRGFEAYWEVQAGRPTAEFGRWVKGPGADLIGTLREALGGLPLIAEDLGVITPEVEALREQFDLPGMRILQFAFGGAAEDRFLPHNYERHTVAYTGTHDNDTTRGWYEAITEEERHHLRRYSARDGSDVAWDLIRLAWASVADWALAPLQDVLDLGTEARMNLPGRPWGNWCWRYTEDLLSPEVLDRLGDMTELYGR
ncbi:MAG TPA: 4-alpha-glucanotransferase [Gemmataceae bacterium]|nr:4-alpha-glucanotransferase [Gemmataceae bacterium]